MMISLTIYPAKIDKLLIQSFVVFYLEEGYNEETKGTGTKLGQIPTGLHCIYIVAQY